MSTTFSPVSIDAATLVSYYSARAGVTSSTTSGSGSTTTAAAAGVTTPWSSASTAAPMSSLTRSVLDGGAYFSTGKSTIGAQPATTSSDIKTLFALYEGLTALEGVAEQAQATGVTASQAKQYQQSFASGLSQLNSFLTANPLKNASVVQGAVSATAQSTVGVKAENDSYVGQTVYTGAPDAEVPAFQGDVQFSLTLTNAVNHTPTQVDFDLSEMGDTPRTMSNVVSYLNGKLADAGVQTRFKTETTPAQPLTVKNPDGTTKTLAAAPNTYSYALQLAGNSLEQASFSAPATQPAVYVSQATGVGTDAAVQLSKLAPSADGSSTGAVFNQTLPSYVTAVRSTATAPDGSVYMLADIDGTTSDGQTVAGASDVALLKYDSAGNLDFTRTLGSSSTANGYGLAVSGDGSQVAVTGTVTGSLDKADASADPTNPETFVSVFDDQGVEQWSQVAQDTGGEQPNAVTFGPDGSVYVTGQTAGRVHGSSSQGGEDAYLLGFDPKGVQTLSTQFGGAGFDKGVGVVATDQGVTVASVENGHAVLRQFASGATGAAQPTATRDLGDLQGGGVAGLTVAADGSLVLAGSTHNGALQAGTVTSAYSGGQSVFVADLSPDLSGTDDSLAYWSAGGDASATGVTVSGGQVYVTGAVAGAPVSGSTTASHTGYAVAIDPSTGQATWSTGFAGVDGQGNPTAIAVDPQGSSVLDALGLPSGEIGYTSPDDLVSNTSLRPGDQFEIQSGSGAPATVTIAQGETLSTLAAKIDRASGYSAAATVVTANGVRQLQIAPSTTRGSVQLISGPAGSDALAALGLKEGTVTAAASGSPTPAAKGVGAGQTITVAKPYSLGVPSTLSVLTAAGAKNAQSVLANAIIKVQGAYSDLTTPPSASSASGSVPAYITAQIANYQLALQRLTGSSS